MKTGGRNGRARLPTVMCLGLACGVLATCVRAPAQEAVVSTVTTSEELPSQGRLGGVAAGSDGSLYVSNFRASVWRIGPDGTVTPLARSIRGSSGVAFDRDGNVLQASFLDNRIVRITPEGVASDVAASGLDGPVGLTVRPDGTILVCNCRSASVTSIGPDGASRVLASGDLFDCPNGITLGPDGGAYVTNYNDGRVVRVDTAGTATLFATVPEGQNAHIAFAGEAFYVTKIASHRIYRVSLDGQNVEPFAGNGEAGFTDGPALTATLAHPNGIAVSPDSTALYINTLDGPWKGEEATRIVLRRISLP